MFNFISSKIPSFPWQFDFVRAHKVQLYHYCRFCRFNGFYPVFFLLPHSSFNFAFSILHFMVYYHITIIARELYFRISSACFFHFRILQTRFVPHFSNFFATLEFLNRQINTVKLCFSGNAHKIQKEKQNLWKIKNHLVKTSHVKANKRKKSDKISSYYRKLCKSLLIEFLPLTEPCGTFCFHCIKFVRDV